MNRNCIFTALLFLVCLSSSYSATVRFAATNQENSEVVALDSVKILNNTNGQDTVLKGQFIIDLYNMTGVETDLKPESSTHNTSIAFDDEVTIPYLSNVSSIAYISVCDITGCVIAKTELNIAAGQNSIRLNARAVPQGVYFLTIESNGKISASKLVKTGRPSGSEIKIDLLWNSTTNENYTAPKTMSAATSQFTAIAYSNKYEPDTVNFDMQSSDVILVFSMKINLSGPYGQFRFTVVFPFSMTYEKTMTPYSSECGVLCPPPVLYESMITLQATLYSNSDTTFEITSYDFIRPKYSKSNYGIPDFSGEKFFISVRRDDYIKGKYYFRLVCNYYDDIYSTRQSLDLSFVMNNFFIDSLGNLCMNITGNDVMEAISYYRHDSFVGGGGYCPPINQNVTCNCEYYEMKKEDVTAYKDAYIKVEYIK